MPKGEHRHVELLFAAALFAGACAGVRAPSAAMAMPLVPGEPAVANTEAGCPEAPTTVAEARPLIDRYCLSCHSPDGAAGDDFDVRSDAAIRARRRNIEAKLRLHVMPPPGAPQPSVAERARLRCWADNS